MFSTEANKATASVSRDWEMDVFLSPAARFFRSLLEAAVLLCEKFTGRLYMLRDIGL